MKLKLTIILLILITTLTMVSAVDLNNLNVPDNFKNVDNMTYDNDETDEEICLIDNSTLNLKSYFINDTELNEIVNPSEKEFIYSFTDGTNNMSGYLELINIDDKDYVVQIWTDGKCRWNKTKRNVRHINPIQRIKQFHCNRSIRTINIPNIFRIGWLLGN